MQILSQDVSSQPGKRGVETQNFTNIITAGPSEVANFEIHSEEEEGDEEDYGAEQVHKKQGKTPTRKSGKSKRKAVSPLISGLRANTKEGRIVLK